MVEWTVTGEEINESLLAQVEEMKRDLQPIMASNNRLLAENERLRADRDEWFALAAKYHEMLTRPTTPPDSGAVDERGTEL